MASEGFVSKFPVLIHTSTITKQVKFAFTLTRVDFTYERNSLWISAESRLRAESRVITVCLCSRFVCTNQREFSCTYPCPQYPNRSTIAWTLGPRASVSVTAVLSSKCSLSHSSRKGFIRIGSVWWSWIDKRRSQSSGLTFVINGKQVITCLRELHWHLGKHQSPVYYQLRKFTP